MLFRLQPLRFSFSAQESVTFREGAAANILRGSLGTVFRGIVCRPECTDPAHCNWRLTCPFARLFAPSPDSPGPSGLRAWPRAFVFRARNLEGQSFGSGTRFHFDLNLFDTSTPMIPYLVQTFARLAQDGLGPRRRKIVLEEVSRLNLQTESEFLIHERSSGTISPVPPVEFDLSPAPQPATRLLVRFLTPTELKAGAQILALPDFGALAARARDRISTLRSAYDEGPLQIDFRAFTESASAVKMTRCEITSVSRERFSSRTGLVHPIGGFVGEAEYEGSLSDFVPYLKLAKWTGVGRQTVWGKGEIEVEVLE